MWLEQKNKNKTEHTVTGYRSQETEVNLTQVKHNKLDHHTESKQTPTTMEYKQETGDVNRHWLICKLNSEIQF